MAGGKLPEPVSVQEVSDAVLRAIATSFGDRPLDLSTARMGLAQAAHDLIQMQLRGPGKRN